MIIPNHSLFGWTYFLCFLSKKRENSSILKWYRPDSRSQVDCCDLKNIQSIDEHLLLFLEGIGSQIIAIDVDKPMIILTFFLILAQNLNSDLKEKGISIHKILSLRFI